MQNLKKKTDKIHLMQFKFFIFYKPACLQKKKFTDDYYPSGYFPRTGTMGTLIGSVSVLRHVINLNQ